MKDSIRHDQMRIACHESAHALISTILGGKLIQLSLKSDGESHIPLLTDPYRIEPGFKGVYEAYPPAVENKMPYRLCVSYAGPAFDAMRAQRQGISPHEAIDIQNGDTQISNAIFRRLCKDFSDNRIIGWLQMVDNVLNHFYDNICLLGKYLIKHKRIFDHDEIVATLSL